MPALENWFRMALKRQPAAVAAEPVLKNSSRKAALAMVDEESEPATASVLAPVKAPKPKPVTKPVPVPKPEAPAEPAATVESLTKPKF